MCEKCETVESGVEKRWWHCKPVEVVGCNLVLYPDLMEIGKSYTVTYNRKRFMVAKTDLGVISIMEV